MWQAVADGSVSTACRTAALEVADALRQLPETDSEQSAHDLAKGAAGVAILYAYLYLEYGGDYGELAERWLRRALEATANQPMSPSLYTGFTGIVWAKVHVEEVLDRQIDSAMEEDIDPVLLSWLSRPDWNAPYDLVYGLAGIGVFALARLPGAVASRSLEKIIHHLDRMAQKCQQGIHWWTPDDGSDSSNLSAPPGGMCDLGMAHGMPGIIAFLALVYRKRISSGKVRRLIEESVRWLLSQERGGGGIFPYWVGKGTMGGNARSAWCYGNPGIAVALSLAADAVGCRAWRSEAIRIVHCDMRRPTSHRGVIDAGLCHGAAGLAQVYGRLFAATGDPAIGSTARSWINKILEMRQPGAGIGGFRSRVGPIGGKNTARWVDDPGMLTGAAGIALTLLAASGASEPRWDRFMLLS